MENLARLKEENDMLRKKIEELEEVVKKLKECVKELEEENEALYRTLTSG